MTRYRIEEVVVTVLGFFVGTALAMCLTPGNVLLWVVAGIVVGIFCRAFFICDLGGELLWPFVGTRQPHDEKTGEQKPVVPQH
jgi:hypothetical protein